MWLIVPALCEQRGIFLLYLKILTIDIKKDNLPVMARMEKQAMFLGLVIKTINGYT
jgi:hypothetical protein